LDYAPFFSMNRPRASGGNESEGAEEGGRKRSRARPFHRPGQLRLGILYALMQLACYGVILYFGIEFARFRDREDGLLLIGGAVGVVVIGLVRMVHGQRVTCPLCHCQVLAEKRCRMHRDARRYWPLSYRASALIDMLLRGTYHCPYCGTLFRLKR
jgi:hypothetical protein